MSDTPNESRGGGGKALKIIIAALIAFAVAISSFILMVVVGGIMFVASINPLCVGAGMILAPVNQVLNGVDALPIGGDGSRHAEKLQLSKIADQVGTALEEQGITRRDKIFVNMVGLQETGMRNMRHLGAANDHDSYGVVQQQSGPKFVLPDGSQYWGTPEQLMDPYYAFHRLYVELLTKLPDTGVRANMSFFDMAMIVQNPSPSAYLSEDNHFPSKEEEATKLLEWAEEQNPTQEPVPQNRSIAVIGDSITVMANQFLFDDLRAAGYSNIRVDAQGARSTLNDHRDFLVPTTSQTGPELTSSKQPLVSGLTAIRNQRESGFDPQDWLILLGTNDIGNLSTDPVEAKEEAKSLILRILDELGPDKRVMWLTVWSTTMPARAQYYNEALMELTMEKENFFVGDWATLVVSNPDLLVDNVHYSTEGSQKRSSFLGGLVKAAVSAIPGSSAIYAAFQAGSALLSMCDQDSDDGTEPSGNYKIAGIESVQRVDRCYGTMRAGASELSAHVAQRWQPTDSGGYSCRNRTTSNELSVHADGRAIDQDFRARDDEEGERANKLFGWLIANAQPLGVQYIKYWKLEWSPHGGLHCNRNRDDIDDHENHIHYELNPAGAARLTPWFAMPTDYPPVEIDQSMCGMPG